MKNCFLLYAILLLMAAPIFSKAQNLPADTLKTQLIKDWERAKAYTALFLEAIPADKYEWEPAKGVKLCKTDVASYLSQYWFRF